MSESRDEKAEEARSIAFECELPEPPEKVWRALTTAELVSEWLLPTDLRAEAGSEFHFSDPAAANDPIDCAIISVVPERSISFSWRDAEARRGGLDSTVTFEIAETEIGGTHLKILHEVRHAVHPASAAPCVTTMATNDNRMQLRLVA